ncbi:universal stress protein [Halalkalibacter oceani]|uniref:Universal stress protein n=1 Tax=Halalkalibacter oceani TaxID=1653776 RepID=A0A9X2DSG4_9BACI|nr:universal stress protein [Halalkalibacter oceani]MCM3715335.1 universal stress protein [Halalkalibacter oceani]
MYNHILVAVDGSQQSEQALAKAIQVAEFHKSSLVIAHIIDLRNVTGAVGFHDSWFVRIENDAKEMLARYKELAEAKGLTKVETVLKSGNPRFLIAEELPKTYHIDLLVTAATGRNRVERLLIGSVAEASVRQAPCDVMIVKNAASE